MNDTAHARSYKQTHRWYERHDVDSNERLPDTSRLWFVGLRRLGASGMEMRVVRVENAGPNRILNV
jgi:hypothetical protein